MAVALKTNLSQQGSDVGLEGEARGFPAITHAQSPDCNLAFSGGACSGMRNM